MAPVLLLYVYIIAKEQLLVNQKKSPANLQGFGSTLVLLFDQ
jgi:hypothetical protein